MGASAAQWKECPLVTKARKIYKNVRTVTKTHETSITSRYNTKHGFSAVTSCTGEFFQNLYDHARQGDANRIITSLLMRRPPNRSSANGAEIAYTLSASRAGRDVEVARVQITPHDQGRRTTLAFAQRWDGALDNSHLLLHSKKGGGIGNAGGFGEGFKVAANSLLGRFPHSSASPCNVWMVMNGRTWQFCYTDFKADSTAASSSEKIDQFVVQEYATEVYGGMVVFVDVPMAATSLGSIWDPNHYMPTMPLATWVPLLPAGESLAVSHVSFLEDSKAPGKFFQLGIYVGTVHGAKGAFFNEGGSVNIGRDRADTSCVLSTIRSAIAKRVTLLPAGTKDFAVMERLMANPAALGCEYRFQERILYKSVLSYVRSRDRVPATTEILIVDAPIAVRVRERLSGARADVHVVGADEELWTYESSRELSEELMIKTFTQLPESERKSFQAELNILATISPSGCVWMLGSWPGSTFKTYTGQSKRYFEDTKSSRNLVPAESVKNRAFFTGLCLDAWGLSNLDPLIFVEEVRSGLNESRMTTIVEKARHQAASGKYSLVDVDADPDTLPVGAAEVSHGGGGGGGDGPGLHENQVGTTVKKEGQRGGDIFCIEPASDPRHSEEDDVLEGSGGSESVASGLGSDSSRSRISSTGASSCVANPFARSSSGGSVSGGSGKLTSSFSDEMVNGPDDGQPFSSGDMVDEEALCFPPQTLKDPSGVRIGGRSDIIDSFAEDEETGFKPGPLRRDAGVELFVAEGVSDQEASECYDRFMSTRGMADVLRAISLTAKSFDFEYAGVSYGPVRDPVVRLFAASPSCRTLGFNVVNDRALWINVSALMRNDSDRRTIISGFVRTAMHQLAHAYTPGCGHRCAWDVAQSLANQVFHQECFLAGLYDSIW